MAQPLIHRLNEHLLRTPVKVALVGCGGTGSQVLSGLARIDRAWRALGHPGGLEVTAWDPDRVTEANVGRQLFSPADLGAYKSDVLIYRLNSFYGLQWESRPEKLPPSPALAHVYVTCVDTAAARRSIGKSLSTGGNYWLDTGNTQDSGQVVLGQPPAKHWNPENRLRTVLEIFPELLDDTVPEDDRPSCSLAEALEQQDLFINQTVATYALQLLWTLFRRGAISHHGYFVNLASGQVNPLPITASAPSKPARRKRSEGRR